MGSKDAIAAATPANHVVHGSSQDIAPECWVPFEWEEPSLGRCVVGEIAVIRPGGTSGNLMAGFFRGGRGIPGAAPDGSIRALYSAPLGDETAVVLEGTATLTVQSSGKKYRIGPGSIVISPKNVEVMWEFDAPYFKKFWCIFDGSQPTPNPPRDLLIANINDNPDCWENYHYTEPKEGAQVAGELLSIRDAGATGTMMTGIWRSGRGMVGTNVDPTGRLLAPYTATLGDETILLLEGEVHITETLSGKKHRFRAGDVIGLSSGMHVTWDAKGPFCKKLFVITRDQLPA